MIALSSIFDVRYGHSLELNALRVASRDSGVAFVSRKMGDNGISAFVERLVDVEPAPAGDISCALGGNGVLTTHLQEQPFYVGRDVAILRPIVPLSAVQILFYCFCVRSNRFRYSYGRQANRTLKSLLVPSLDNLPGWLAEYDVEMFTGSDLAKSTKSPSALGEVRWRPFALRELFELRKGKRLTKAQLKGRPGSIPFIGAIDSNNGVTGFVNAAIHEAGTLTVNYNGAGVADAFYQASAYWASDDVNVLYPKFAMTPAIALFIATLIRKEKYRFNYGRKWHLERMTESEIQLPVLADGSPDWTYMNQLVESLPFSSQIDAR